MKILAMRGRSTAISFPLFSRSFMKCPALEGAYLGQKVRSEFLGIMYNCMWSGFGVLNGLHAAGESGMQRSFLVLARS